ncbi:ZIP family metal transporter [Corynebacterium sp. UBA2622]|uniref:ZIP family metal transporter n=1 Tax=Corynebacterium sp. UBA2622 TaxID=1946393 RepID=UPI0025BD7B21|nr:ZIP family metal transporter [Corynebacterium sp. UBA2622]
MHHDPAAIATAFVVTLLAGLSMGLGGLLVALKREPSRRFFAAALGFAAGVMLYISLGDLLAHGSEEASPASAVAAFFVGLAVIALVDALVPHGRLSSGAGAMTALAFALHNVPEGLATFLATLEDPHVGVPIAIAVALHNVPAGIAVAAPIRHATGRKWRAAGWATAVGLVGPAAAALGYLLLVQFVSGTGAGVNSGLVLAGVGGAMVYIAVSKLLPEAYDTDHRELAGWGAFAGMAVIAVGVLLLHEH